MFIARRDYDLQMLRFRFQFSYTAPSLFKLHSIMLALLVGCLLFPLIGCSAGTSRTSVSPKATVHAVRYSTPTPATIAARTVLYQAEWSHGLVGWQGTRGWKVVQGQLETDSSNPTMLIIPYRPQVTNYALEIQLQIVRLLQPNGGGYFSIFASRVPGKDGYQAGASNLVGSVTQPFGNHPQVQVLIDPLDAMSSNSGLPTGYYSDSQWHTYRVEVQGNEVRLLEDDIQISYASSSQTEVLSNGPIGLSSALIVLRVSSVRIIAL
jgi:hypothetical protein